MKFNKLMIVALSSASLFLFACAGAKPSDGKKNDEQKLVTFTQGIYGITNVEFDKANAMVAELGDLKEFATNSRNNSEQLLFSVIDNTSGNIDFVTDYLGTICTISIPASISLPSDGQIEIKTDSKSATQSPSGCIPFGGTASAFASAYESVLDGVYNYSFTGNDFTMSPVADSTTVISGSKK